jgi:hypothetical protein
MSNNSAPANEGLVASGRIDKAKEFVVVEFPGTCPVNMLATAPPALLIDI